MSGECTNVASPSQTAGPFFHVGLPSVPPAEARDPIRLVIHVTDGNATAVPDAVIELWYVAQAAMGPQVPGTATFARACTDSDGRLEFALAPPARTGEAIEPPSSPHINVCLFARGLLRQVYTRIYFEGESTLEQDGVLAMVPPERRQTLIARRDAARPDQWLFHLRLQGADETVFFAI